MNNNSAETVNTRAAIAVMAVFLLLATLFGSPAGSAPTEPDTAAVSLQVDGQ